MLRLRPHYGFIWDLYKTYKSGCPKAMRLVMVLYETYGSFKIYMSSYLMAHIRLKWVIHSLWAYYGSIWVLFKTYIGSYPKTMGPVMVLYETFMRRIYEFSQRLSYENFCNGSYKTYMRNYPMTHIRRVWVIYSLWACYGSIWDLYKTYTRGYQRLWGLLWFYMRPAWDLYKRFSKGSRGICWFIWDS